MRKVKFLLAAALSLIAWTGTMATVTQPTLTTDRSNPAFYTIKNFRTGKYATYTGASSQLSQEVNLTKAGLWFFEENGSGVSIIPAKDPSVKLAGHSSATETGAVWYLVENPHRAGYFCVTLSNNASSNCWDDQGNQTKIGYWQPSASDNQGTSWIIEPYDVENPIEVTYEMYDGGTKVSSATVVQGANSEPAVPTSLKEGMVYGGFFHEKFYLYDYAFSGTIGDTDCTITITRTEKAGVVKALTDLSNNKAYNIGCDRGAMIAYDGKMVNTALNDAEANAQPYGKFALLKYEDNYYIFSVDEKKFVKNDASVALDLTAAGFSTADAIVMELKTAPYFLWHFNADGKYLNTNGNAPLGYVINSYSTPDQGNQYYMVEAGDFDPTDALAELDAYFHPSYFVTYVVKDEAGNTLYTSEPQPAKNGAKITALPADFQRPFYSYNDVDVTISQQETTVEFTATWAGPFEISTDFATAHWYDMAMRSTWYVTSGAKDANDGDAYVTQNANTMGLVEDSYQWAFIGNGYDGFKIINKAEGEGKSFGWTDAQATNAGIPTVMDDSEGNHAWNIVPSTNTTVPAGSFCLNVPGTNLYINQYGGAGGKVKFWNSANNLGDAGSAFTVFDVPSNFASFVADEIAPYFETTAKYFVLSDAAKAEIGYDESYKTECPFETYKNMKEKLNAAIADLSNFVLPETGYYILKNRNYGTYMGIDPSDANMYGNYKAADQPKHIVKLTKNDDNTYTIGLMGKYAPATVAQSAQVKANTEAGTYTVVIPAFGYAAFQADAEAQYSALHRDAAGKIVGWEAAANASQWEVIEAESIQLTIGETGYATAYLPFPATPAGVYTPEIPKALGTWTFDDSSDLTAGTGTATLEMWGTGVTAADGPDADNGAVSAPNGGGFTLDTHLSEVSSAYTLLMDVSFPDVSGYNSLYQNDINNGKDGSIFINGGTIGLNYAGLGYNGSISANTWYRIAIVVDNGYCTIYVDGEKVSASTSQDINAWVMRDTKKFLLFVDNNGEEKVTNTSEVRFWDVALTAGQVEMLGGVGHVPSPKASDLKVYTASLETNERGNFFLGMNELEGTIPEATPVILKATPDTYIFNIGEGEEVVPDGALKLNETEVDASNALVKGYAATLEENVLKGTFAPIDAAGLYVLAKPTAEEPIGFYLADKGTIAAGKAYLELAPSVDVKALYFDFGGEATGMSEELRMKNEESKGKEIYNLAGQRLNKAQKGINIVNGKKILF